MEVTIVSQCFFQRILCQRTVFKISFARYKNQYQMNVYLNVLGLDRETKIIPSTQF